MIISIIAALDKKFVIGNKGRIPWHLPADLAHFRELTMGKPIIMGRTTFESIGRLLPGRLNIVLTRDPCYKPAGVVAAHSIEEALHEAGAASEIMVIGGADVYRQFMSLAHRMYLTFVESEFEGDAYFPPVDQKEWKEVSREAYTPDKKNPYPYTFVILERN